VLAVQMASLAARMVLERVAFRTRWLAASPMKKLPALSIVRYLEFQKRATVPTPLALPAASLALPSSVVTWPQVRVASGLGLVERV
jgi:hypothetical protein